MMGLAAGICHTHPSHPLTDSRWPPKELGAGGRLDLAGADNIRLAIRILDRPKGPGGARSFPCPGDPAAGLPEASQSGGQPTGRQKSAAITSSLELDHLSTPAYSSLVSILHFLPRPSHLLLSPSVFLLLWLQMPVSSLMDKHPLQGTSLLMPHPLSLCHQDISTRGWPRALGYHRPPKNLLASSPQTCPSGWGKGPTSH